MTPGAGRDYESHPFRPQGAEELTRRDSSTHHFSVTTGLTTWKVGTPLNRKSSRPVSEDLFDCVCVYIYIYCIYRTFQISQNTNTLTLLN